MMAATTPRPPEAPRIDILVAVYNEAPAIAGKIANLEALDYPGDRLRFVIADGGSTDATADRLAEWAARDQRVTCLASPVADKAAQLNAALEKCTADWVLVTDADALMPPETLRLMVEETRKSPAFEVVGTLASTPGHELEMMHWRVSNWIRRRERRFGTTGLVIATCYLFRRSLVDRFPKDCAADDVHVACRAAATGARVGLAESTVLETRAPASIGGILRHKMRRTRGYLREVLRFLPAVPRMPARTRTVFLWRALALLGIPVLAMASLVPVLIAAAGGVFSTGFALAVLAGLVATAGTAWALGRYRSRQGSTMVVYSALTLAILSLALFSYPLVRKTASLKRVGPA